MGHVKRGPRVGATVEVAPTQAPTTREKDSSPAVRAMHPASAAAVGMGCRWFPQFLSGPQFWSRIMQQEAR